DKVVPSVRVERVFVVPPEQFFTARAQLLLGVFFDRENLVDDVAVLLSSPADRPADERSEQDQEKLFSEDRRLLRSPLPVHRRVADVCVVDGVAGNQANTWRGLLAIEVVEKGSYASGQFVGVQVRVPEEFRVFDGPEL